MAAGHRARQQSPLIAPWSTSSGRLDTRSVSPAYCGGCSTRRSMRPGGSRRRWAPMPSVVASPLLRARQTVQPVAERAGRGVTTDARLLDRDYGQ